MLNQCALVGKIKELPEMKKTNSGTITASLIIEVDRNFRNSSGQIEQDIFSVQVWRGIAEECCNICKVNSIVAIRGRLNSRINSTETSTFYNTDIIAEKVTFIKV
ncbi:MAG: single-stranded DNA-binding protein [Anaerorhabdus sp.]